MPALDSSRPVRVAVAYDSRSTASLMNVARQLKAALSPLPSPAEKLSPWDQARAWMLKALTTLLVFLALVVVALLVFTIVWDSARKETRVTIALPKAMTDAGVTQPIVSTAFADRINAIAQYSRESTSPMFGWDNTEDNTLSYDARSTANSRNLLGVVSSIEGAAGLAGASALISAALELLERLSPPTKSIDVTMAMEPDGKAVLAQTRLSGFESLREQPAFCRTETRDVGILADCLAVSFLKVQDPVALVAACLPNDVGVDVNGFPSARAGTPIFLVRVCADSESLERLLTQARLTSPPAAIPRILNLEGRRAQQQRDYETAIWKYEAAIRFANGLPGDQRGLLTILYANLAAALAAEANDTRQSDQQRISLLMAKAVRMAESALDISRLDTEKLLQAATLLSHIHSDSCRLQRLACRGRTVCMIHCDADRAEELMKRAHWLDGSIGTARSNWVWGYALRSRAEAAKRRDERAELFAAASDRFERSFMVEWANNNIARRDAAQTALAEVRERPDRHRFERAINLTRSYLEFDSGGPYPVLVELLLGAARQNVGEIATLETCYNSKHVSWNLATDKGLLIYCLRSLYR